LCRLDASFGVILPDLHEVAKSVSVPGSPTFTL
jgi:hypothetical protein